MNSSKASIKNIEKIAFKNLYEINNEEQLFRYLKVWWCSYYKRPSKDPLLNIYILEELLLEYFEQNLFNNKERVKEIEQEWLAEAMSDDEWYAQQEKDLGQIKEINPDEIKEIHDKYTGG